MRGASENGRRIGRGLAVVLVLAAVALLAAILLYLDSKRPQRSGEVGLPGLGRPVEVVFDRHAVPHIYAAGEEDAYRALGYVHAQDRLFQMELLRRTANGELADVLGAELVETDRFFRTLQIARFAREYVDVTLPAVSPGVRTALEAYLAGVNQFAKSGPSPLEFDILGIPRPEFTAADVFGIGGLIAYDFALANWTDPLLTYIRSVLGERHLAELVWSGKPLGRPAGPGPLPPASAALQIPSPVFGPHGRFGGSNGWVLGPSRTASGAVILANDPHIGYAAPSVWYEAHLALPGLNLYGHHLAGIPFALLGHTDRHGWGLTMANNDDLDFFVEEAHPEHPHKVRFRDRWEDLAVADEIIRVRGADDVTIRVRRSRHGPIINDVMPGVAATQAAPVAMWWGYRDLTNHVLAGFYELARADGLSAARDSVRKMHAPGVNVIYGDRDGNIAWWMAARLPLRPPHVDSRFLLDGAGGADELDGFLPFADNPQRENPPEGFLVSANNRPPAGAGAPVAGYFAPDDRVRRITELLEDGRAFTPEDMRVMMLDTASASGRRVSETLLGLLDTSGVLGDGSSVEAARILRDWDGTHGREKTGPTVLHEFVAQLIVETFADELPQPLFDDLLRTRLLDWTVPPLLERAEAAWWDDVKTPDRREGRGEVVARAWRAALDSLRNELGPEPALWRWGAVHQLEHVHAMGRGTLLARIFNVGPFPAAGGRKVLNQQRFRQTPGPKPVHEGPSTRRIIEFIDPPRSLGVNPTGQAGHPFDRHYRDQAELFQAGRLRPQLMERADILDDAQGILRLTPVP